MAGVKFWNTEQYGGWVDAETVPNVIKKWDGAKWVDGNSSNPAKVFRWDGSKHIQLFPKTEARAYHTWNASNLSYINDKMSSWRDSTARGGMYIESGTTYDYYTGWMNIVGKGWFGGAVNVIENISVSYIRHGAGYWDSSLKIPLCVSRQTGIGLDCSLAQAYKDAPTFYSDTAMPVCPALGEKVNGTTTLNSTTAKAQIKTFMQTGKSLVVGESMSGGKMIALSSFSMTVTYTHPTTYALFDNTLANKYKDISYLTNDNGYIGVYLYEDELDKSLEEIIENRISNNIPPIEVI